MTTIGIPDVPVPVGAVPGDWCFLGSPYPEEAYRSLTWARFDAAGIVVAIEGAQYGDGRVHRFVGVDGTELASSVDARQLAAALLNAADALDELNR